jgi:hypothetical protein
LRLRKVGLRCRPIRLCGAPCHALRMPRLGGPGRRLGRDPCKSRAANSKERAQKPESRGNAHLQAAVGVCEVGPLRLQLPQPPLLLLALSARDLEGSAGARRCGARWLPAC